jgi:CRISPR-associated endoribonuclease Cas6
LSYEYYLSSAIYKWIELSSPEFSAFLHDHAYSPEQHKRSFKHFCFSQLFAERSHVQDERIFFDSDTIMWYVGMVVEEALQHFVTGLFEKRRFFIDREYNTFVVEQVEMLPDPVWTSLMKFKTLSPITVSVAEERNGKLLSRYLKADDPHLQESLRNNLLRRYESLYGILPQNQEFRCIPDAEYITRRGSVDRISKLVTIKKGMPDETKVRGFRCPVTLEGSLDLIKLAYESGLGEKGSVGFGMIEEIR